MPIATSMLPEFDYEMRTTHRVLERTPEADVAWRPHPKSYSLGDLAMHLSNIPAWVEPTLKQPELDFSSTKTCAPP